MKKLVEHYCELPGAIRPALWRAWHGVLNRLDSGFHNVFLNYGYAGHNGEFDNLVLEERDEPDRYGIQLYRQVTGGMGLKDARVLEVGCGRGGGASYLARYDQPAEYVGLDISRRLIGFCNNFHRVPGLRFVYGSALQLPFEHDRFDAVVNIESARCYGDIGAFFRETYRVLKPGGHFFFADMMRHGHEAETHRLLLDAGFVVIRQKDIRKNVVRALQIDGAARKKVIDERTPAWLRSSFYEFAGIPDSRRFREFDSGILQYQSYVLQKQNNLPT